MEEKKNKALWRLEKIDMKGSPNRQGGKANSSNGEEEYRGGPA